MNIRKNIDYSELYARINKAFAANLSQMELYLKLGRLVSGRPEKGAAVMAAEYITANYPDRTGFSPRSLRRMRDFYRMYESRPEVLAQAMKIGWTQNIVILEADLDMEARCWYLQAVRRFGWSKAELVRQIDSDTYPKKCLTQCYIVCYNYNLLEINVKNMSTQKRLDIFCIICYNFRQQLYGRGVLAMTEESIRKPFQQCAQFDEKQTLVFDEETIRMLFGHEAAEDETIDRLKAYYLKTNIYNSMKSNLPLLILVGHKGVGKSALLKVLSTEDSEENHMPITVQPNDIVDVDVTNQTFLKRIEIWKDGLSSIILEKIIKSISEPLVEMSEETGISSFLMQFSSLISKVVGKKITDFQREKISLSSTEFSSILKNSLFSEKKVVVYLDDLDRGWENKKDDIKNLSAMLNAIRDLSREVKNLKFRVALRSDVYYAVRTSDETTDKIDGSVIWQSWTNHEILVMLIKRIETYFGRDINEQDLLSKEQREIGYFLNSVFENNFHGSGHWENAPMYRVIMSLIRKRPRDLVKLCTLAARKAYSVGHNQILTNDLESVFQNYSNDRLTDTSTEYKSELPKIQELLLKMKPSAKELASSSPCLFDRGQLLKKLENILSMSNFSFQDGKAVTADSLAAFLYKINFITARKTVGNEILRVYYDEAQYICNNFADFGYSYEIHPAYRWALQPSSKNLFRQIELLESK